jgi:hypothetical protein
MLNPLIPACGSSVRHRVHKADDAQCKRESELLGFVLALLWNQAAAGFTP